MQSLQAVIIADLHLSDHTPELLERFLQLLTELPNNCQQLYILGDLVDFWPGDDVRNSYGKMIVEGLRSLSDSGVSIFIQRGNRDFLFGRQFAKQSNATLLADYHLTQLANRPVLLMHGDLLCTNDVGYLRMRKIFHWQWLRVIWQLLPLLIRQRIIEKVQRESRAKANMKADNITDVTQQAVVDSLIKYRVVDLIHGHTHRPKVHQFKVNQTPAQRIVLGDWGKNYWWVEVSNNAIELKQAPLTTEFKLPIN